MGDRVDGPTREAIFKLEGGGWGGEGIKTQLAGVLQVPLESDCARLTWGRACPCRLGVIGSVPLEVDVPGQIILVHKVS